MSVWKVRLHPHALLRIRERGATKDEVIYTVRHGKRSAAAFGRALFTHRFAYNRKWHGRLYRFKVVEAFAVEEKANEWLVVTVVTKYF